MDLAVVVDCSGATAGEPFESTRAWAWTFVQRLRPTDRLAVVAAGGAPRLVLPLGTGDGQRALHALHRLRPGGASNALRGWLAAYTQVRASTGTLREIVMFTDQRPDAVTWTTITRAARSLRVPTTIAWEEPDDGARCEVCGVERLPGLPACPNCGYPYPTDEEAVSQVPRTIAPTRARRPPQPLSRRGEPPRTPLL